MADEPQDPLVRALLGLPPVPKGVGSTLLGGMTAFGSLAPHASALSEFIDPSPPSTGNGLSALASPSPFAIASSLANPPKTFLRTATTTNLLAPIVDRMTYFAFSFDDVMRVNNVRQTGKIGPRVIGRSRGFLDRSIWEKRNIKNEDSLKRLMQQAMTQSSVICVLVGADTWNSRWVRYEIALSVINKRGLLAVHINSINSVGGTGPDPLGVNPLHFMGIHRDKSGKYYLVERKPAILNEATGDVGFKWNWYDDYQLEVPRPRYIPELGIGAVVPLSTGTATYDYTTDLGSRSIGFWLDSAAIQVGR
jgi:MTH538 TIR-like domain (DUF1863)